MIMNNYWRTRFRGPIAPYAHGLRETFEKLGYARSTVTSHLALWAQLSQWLADQDLTTYGLSADRVEEFLKARRQAGRRLYSIKALAPGLEFLREVGAAPGIEIMVEASSEVEVIAEQFRDYLLFERGLAEVSADTYVLRARPFLSDRARDGHLDLASLTAAEVSSFVAAWLPGLSTSPAKSTVTALRSLLSFLHASGVIDRPLASAIPTVASWRLAGLPSGLSRTQVQALLDTCDQSTMVGLRDSAIITVLVRLGLRSSEAAGLMLDDIDWRTGVVRIRGKGNSDERLPLPIDVGSALSRYLEHGRPSSASDRVVFIRAKAPYRALHRKSISTMVSRAASRAGMGTLHAHALRHTLATEVLSQGACLDEVGQLLRHRSRASTAIYAKVDQHRLIQLARPWPTSAGPR